MSSECASPCSLEHLRHRPRIHAAARTTEYLFHQLIPYLGSKRRLLPLIAEAVRSTGVTDGVFLDAFAGSGVVSRLAKTLGFSVLANDWEPYCGPLNRAYVEADRPPPFTALGGMESVYSALNAIEGCDGYLATHYCPRKDDAPDLDRERLFFTRANGRRLDAMREAIDEWWRGGALTEEELSVLLASLIYSACYVSNTSGVFKAFHRGWGGSNGTALYRIMSPVTLSPPILHAGVAPCRAHGEDAQRVLAREPASIVYLDPPYNQHQYGANYHLLNTLALWDKPPVCPRIGTGAGRNKSAIRRDWRTQRRSAFCHRASAEEAFFQAVAAAQATWVLVSYSSEGLIPLPRLEALLRTFGEVSRVEQEYRRYRVSPTRPSPKPYSREFVLVLNKEG
ncbi:MAG TPA: DNA adenine methylase [Armatimonadota bacterium]